MKTITFTIHGNHEDPTGNPVPYARQTQRQLWTKQAKRYREWQNYVRAAFYQAAETNWLDLAVQTLKGGRIKLPHYLAAKVSIAVFWATGNHGDLDNVLKGILDSIFVDDRNIKEISAKSSTAPDGRGRVEVIIAIEPKI
jgi:Holliday junction resolvase RusA-like endonuclease